MMDNYIRKAIDSNLSKVHVSQHNVNQIIESISEGKKVKKKLSIGLVLLIALILIVGMAFALTRSYVLEYLYGKNNEQTAEQQESVQTVDLVHTNAGVETSVKDAIFDGETLSVGLTFDAEEQIYIVTNAISVNGISLELDTSSLEDQWASGNPFQAETGCQDAFGFCGNLNEALLPSENTADVIVSLTLLTPQTQVHAIDTYQDDQKAMWEEINASIAAGKTPVDQDEPYPVLVGSSWLGDDFNTDSPVQYPLNAAEAYESSSNMRVIDTFDLIFTLKVER